MDPFSLLKKDHQKVRALFEEFAGLGDRAFKHKEKIVTKAIGELEIHTQVEEEILYPAIKRAIEKEGKELVLEAYEEHAVVKRIIKELKGLTPRDETFNAKFKVIEENVKHHIKEEENELFPQAKKALGEEAEEIGEKLKTRKLELLGKARATLS